MQEYKKSLVELRNNYIFYKKLIEERKVKVLEQSFEKQREYLNKKTFYLISNNNFILKTIGNFIANVLLKKQTEEDLMDIVTDDIDEFEQLVNLYNKYDLEYKKIIMTLDFINSIDEEEFNKLIFKQN